MHARRATIGLAPSVQTPGSAIHNPRSLILSDLHLGRPRFSAASADALRPLWQGCTRLIINGDVAEVHHPTRWSLAARQVLRLHDLCETDGVELTLLSGNHDPYVTDVRHLELCDGRVFITHGDVLHPAVAPWSPRAGIMREAHQRAVAAIPEADRDHLDARLKVSQFASHAEWAAMAQQAAKSTVPQMLLRPWSMFHVLWYWRRFPPLAAAFLQQHAPRATVGVFGHTHHAGIWRIGHRTIINSGCYGFPGRPRAVMIEEVKGEVRLFAIERGRKSQAYRFAGAALCCLDLGAAAHAPADQPARTRQPLPPAAASAPSGIRQP